jgi:spore maturation protein CgeB/ubiquinone/menaquinone biosynthesis C-methylase UbiE
MMAPPRILSFNFHEPYLYLMAKTGLPFDIGLYESGPMARDWQTHYRPIPSNLHLIPEKRWREDLDKGVYRVLLAHNESNALDVSRAPCAKLLLCHNRRTFLNSTVTTDSDDPVATFDWLLDTLQEIFSFLFISESKRASYGIPGNVILPGIDVEEYGPYSGKIDTILRVGNLMSQRNLMFDMGFQETVCQGLPNRLVGTNPENPEARPAASFDELRGLYREARCILHVTRQEFEDGYNLALLEAMASGMPAVSLANRSSPIEDGVNGYASFDAVTLRRRLKDLLADRDQAAELGARARETVAKRFPMSRFVDQWRETLLTAAEQPSRPPQRLKSERTPEPLKLLMQYHASPMTTGRYLEAAANRVCDVLSAGFRIPEEVFYQWGFPAPCPVYPPHRIFLDHHASYAELLNRLPRGYKPQLFLWVDSGPREIAPFINMITAPRAAYLIDTHVSFDLRLAMARHFDVVFLAQKAQVEPFRAAGINPVFWLPLACDPDLHRTGDLPRKYDVAYVGSLSEEEGHRRHDLLGTVAARFPNHWIGRAWPEDMARIYAQSKIVVNISHNRDVNMRVFEAMASGALLITDEAEGLDDLFEDGKHLLVFRDDASLLDLIARYLEDEETRTRIARAGQTLTLTQHTYDHRMKALLEQARAILPASHPQRDQYESKLREYYECPRYELMHFIPQQAQRVLDVGCGAGAFGDTLKKERGALEVSGIEMVEEAWKKASLVLDRALLGNIETMDLPFEESYFDCIVCGDVLEHLVDPVAALRKLTHVLKPDGIIVISIPNVRFYDVIRMLSNGAWTYMQQGILDETHLRFYTKSALRRLVEDAGLVVAHLYPLSRFDAERCPRNPDASLTLGKVTITALDESEYEEFCVFQFVALAAKPGNEPLAKARKALLEKRNEEALALALDAVGADESDQHWIAAKALARLGRLDEAETCYREALARRADPVIEGELGILLVAKKQMAEARFLLESALAKQSDLDRVRAALGLLCLADGAAAAAFDHFAAALDASYDHLALIDPFLQTAVALGRFDDAEPLLARYAGFYPGNLDLACRHAEVLVLSGRVTEARERLDMVLALSPDHSTAKALLDRLQ